MDITISDPVNMPDKDVFFKSLMKEIKHLNKTNTIALFDEKKIEWINRINEKLSETTLGDYIIEDVNDVCLCLGMFDIAYEGSFIKLFEIFYRETFVDIPQELWSRNRPHIDYLKRKLKLDIKCDKYTTLFTKYFRKIYDEVSKNVSQLGFEILQVKVTDQFFHTMSDIAFGLYIGIGKEIASCQENSACFGKSTRIQFFQIYGALTTCVPRLHSFTKSQKAVLHYILLSKKTIDDSILTLMSKSEDEEPTEKRSRPSRKKHNI